MDNQYLISLTDRYLLEKDLDGLVVETLDLRSLLKAEALWDADCQNEAEWAGHVVKLTFDYVKKDRRERSFVMEDEASAEVAFV